MLSTVERSTGEGVGKGIEKGWKQYFGQFPSTFYINCESILVTVEMHVNQSWIYLYDNLTEIPYYLNTSVF